MKKHTNINPWKHLVAAGALALLVGLPASAQPAQMEPADLPQRVENMERQPAIRTYEKMPDPSGQSLDVEVSTYNKKPDPSGQSQSLDYVRYDEQNDANNGRLPEPTLIYIDEGGDE